MALFIKNGAKLVNYLEFVAKQKQIHNNMNNSWLNEIYV